jgi:excinuclease ABC subunit A
MAKSAAPTAEVTTAEPLFNEDFIQVIGAREHNLKDIDVAIPRNQLVVITGISGSGKSSLAFDTIYAEGQRRYMETFSAYARQFIGEMERPEVEQITGLSPVISIEQKTTGRNPRSTVGTVTEVYDFLRLLFARVGEAYSYETGQKMVSYTEAQIREQIFVDFQDRKISVLAPLVRGRKGHYRELFEQMRKQGYTKMRIDGQIEDITPGMQVDRYKVHDLELVIDRLKVGTERSERLTNSLETALKMGNDLVMIADHEDDRVVAFSRNLMDATSGLSYEEPSPNTFSFNSPYGYCQECKGLGVVNAVDESKVIPDDSKSINDAAIAPFGEVRDNMTFKQLRAIAKKYKFSFSTPVNEIPAEALRIILHGGDESFQIRSQSAHDFSYNLAKEGIIPMLQRWYDNSTSEKVRRWAEDFMTIDTCASCNGQRLRKEALHFKIHGKNISDLAQMDLVALEEWINTVEPFLSNRQQLIGKDIFKEIRFRLEFLLQVGLDYLNLDRPARTLSGGEAQRIRLATQIGSMLTGITYILDEPSIGLHQRDNQRLIEALRELTDIGNTVLVVEHDRDIMLASDYLIDLGPGAGRLGGELVAQGLPQDIVNAGKTLTAQYLSRQKDIEIPRTRRTGNGKFMEITGATGNNLQAVDVTIPLGTFCCITGVSGSGKSTLINETLYPILRQHFYRSLKPPLAYKTFSGLEHVDKVIEIDQSPIGRTPRSNPATYTGLFTDIRTLFSNLPEAKIRGYKPGRFSFNVKGGRCETCEGSGMRRIEMNFLPDVYVECETCLGRRYNRETLEILYKGKSINDVLEMPVSEAAIFFEHLPKLFRKLKTISEVGLGYITLGQQATTLSGGEAQRVKLAEELSKRDTGNTVYILDEPTTGLHFEDIRFLLKVLNKLTEKGNTVIVIEHNLDVIKVADHVIDMGPEGGRRGGTLVVAGTPEEVAQCPESHTGHHLRIELADSKRAE